MTIRCFSADKRLWEIYVPAFLRYFTDEKMRSYDYRYQPGSNTEEMPTITPNTAEQR